MCLNQITNKTKTRANSINIINASSINQCNIKSQELNLSMRFCNHKRIASSLSSTMSTSQETTTTNVNANANANVLPDKNDENHIFEWSTSNSNKNTKIWIPSSSSTSSSSIISASSSIFNNDSSSSVHCIDPEDSISQCIDPVTGKWTPEGDDYQLVFINSSESNSSESDHHDLDEQLSMLDSIELQLDVRNKQKVLKVRSHIQMSNGTVYVEDSDWEMCSEYGTETNSDELDSLENQLKVNQINDKDSISNRDQNSNHEINNINTIINENQNANSKSLQENIHVNNSLETNEINISSDDQISLNESEIQQQHFYVYQQSRVDKAEDNDDEMQISSLEIESDNNEVDVGSASGSASCCSSPSGMFK